MYEPSERDQDGDHDGKGDGELGLRHGEHAAERDELDQRELTNLAHVHTLDRGWLVGVQR